MSDDEAESMSSKRNKTVDNTSILELSALDSLNPSYVLQLESMSTEDIKKCVLA